MARPTLGTHPKFFRLAALVGGRAVARGALELIWEAAYASGDPFIGDAATVESLADWRGDQGALAEALVVVGFLDVEDGGHFVHDLEDHAPSYVLKRWEKESERQAKGETLRSIRQAAARARWSKRTANGYANGERLHSKSIAAVTPPAPAPAPAPQISPPSPARDLGPPEPGTAPPPPAEALWGTWLWKEKYGLAWCAKYQRAFYGMPSDAKGISALADLLDQMPQDARLAAQERAGRMFSEFLGDASPNVVRARHPFAFFVQAFGGLLVDRQAVPTTPNGRAPPVDTRPMCEPHKSGRLKPWQLPGAAVKADPNCTHCAEARHQQARRGTREGDPEPVATVMEKRP